MKIWESWA